MNQSRKRWMNMSPAQRTAITIVGFIQFLMLVAAQIDLTIRPAEQVRGKKGYWRLAALINFWGPLAYFIFGIRRGESQGSALELAAEAETPLLSDFSGNPPWSNRQIAAGKGENKSWKRMSRRT